MRINKYIARSGVTSRRKAEDLILSGRISVDGNVIKSLSTEIDENNSIVKIDDKKISLPKSKYYLFNKPTGYTTTKSDPFAMHTIFELLPKDSSLFAVGRLDRDTSGLIIITNDGDFAQNIIHPTKKIEKEYAVKTRLAIANDQLEALENGIELEDGAAKAKKITKISNKELIIIIEMGRKRIIKRMIQAVGNKVVGLQRTRIGSINLDIPVGKYRELTKEEIKEYA